MRSSQATSRSRPAFRSLGAPSGSLEALFDSLRARFGSRRALVDVLGLAALVATLALTSLGVRIARADDPAPLMSVDPVLAGAHPAAVAQAPVKPEKPLVPHEKGPSCSDTAPPPMSDALIQYQTERMLRAIALRAAAQQPPGEQDADHGIVLNGQGYNYRPSKLR